MAVTQFDVSFGQRFTNHNNGGNTNQFGIFKLDAGGYAIAVVDKNFQSLCFKFSAKFFTSNGDVVAILSGDNDVNINRRNRTWPLQANLIVEHFGN